MKPHYRLRVRWAKPIARMLWWVECGPHATFSRTSARAAIELATEQSIC